MDENKPSESSENSVYDVPMDLPGDKKPRRKLNLRLKKKWFFAGVSLLILVVVAIFILTGSKNSQDVAIPESEQTIQSSDTQLDIPEATNSKTYNDDTIGFNVSYPATWTLAKTTSSGTRLTSPDFTYQTIDSEVTGNFRIYIRTGARKVDGKYIGRGLAVKSSEKLIYNKPLRDQRKTTFLTSFGLDSPDNFSFFLIAGNFNLKKGDSLGPNYGKEPETFIITGGYSDESLEDDLATNPVPVDSYDQGNAYAQAVGIVKSLQLR